MGDPYKIDVELPLEEFIEDFQLPQTVKVTEGVYDPTSADFDFANGEVLHLQQKVCASALLTIKSSNSEMSVSVSPSHMARFQLVKFDPRRPWMRGNGIRFRTVKELVEACPLLVRAGKSYIHPTQPHTRFSAGTQFGYCVCYGDVVSSTWNVESRDSPTFFACRWIVLVTLKSLMILDIIHSRS